MIKVYTTEVSPLGANCHIVVDESNPKVLIIDPGGDFFKIEEVIQSLNKSSGAVLLTHGHFDHIGAAHCFAEQGVPVYMGEKDVGLVSSSGNLAKYFGLKMQPFIVDNQLIEGDFDICGFKVGVIETPGHTAGGLCYTVEDAMFTGDTLFAGSFGRTDFPSGDTSALVGSAKKLFALQKDYILYTGHGEGTRLFKERLSNPIKTFF